MKNILIPGIAILIFSGCQRAQPPASDRVSDTPLLIDEAMQKRDWEPSTSSYPNGATVAGGTGFILEPNKRVPPDALRIVGPAAAVGNDILLPITIFFNPPWSSKVYPGAAIPPTYTAQPPLE